jgi:hypothetical protein
MTQRQVERLKAGRPGTRVLVRGTVREVEPGEQFIEVQFSDYSLSIPIKDIVLPKKVK